MNFIELAGFGLNILTVSFIAIIILTPILAYGLWQNIEVMRTERSSTTIDIPHLIYLTLLTIAGAFYGLRHDQLAFVIAGAIMAITCLRVLDVAIRFEARIMAQLFIPVIAILVYVITYAPQWVVIGIMGALYTYGAIMAAIMARHIYDNLPCRTYWAIILIISLIAWHMYGFEVGNVELVFACLTSIMVLGVALIAHAVFYLKGIISAGESRDSSD